MVSVREAEPRDARPLARLLAILFAQEADFTPDVERHEAGIRAVLDEPSLGRIFVAQSEDGIIGMVSLLFTVSTAEGGPAAWLEDFVVHPDHRARGVGTLLLRSALRAARARGVIRVTLSTDADNHGAHRLYVREGFRPSTMQIFRWSPNDTEPLG